jgi:hypothetical protein
MHEYLDHTDTSGDGDQVDDMVLHERDHLVGTALETPLKSLSIIKIMKHH